MPLGTYNSMTMLFERIFVPIGALYKYFGTIWTVHIFYGPGSIFCGWEPATRPGPAGRPASQPHLSRGAADLGAGAKIQKMQRNS